jgi:hypothetical protein
MRARGGCVNREQIYEIMSGEGTLDYELYLNTKAPDSPRKKSRG